MQEIEKERVSTRDLKFRAWDLIEREMVAGFYVRADGDIYWESDDGDAFPEAEPNNLVVMQFTGLLDKNGKEIYEGDILRSALKRDGKLGLQTAVVEFVECGFWARFVSASPPEFRHFSPGGGIQPHYWDTLSQVIGNIHENPELLK